MARTVTKSLASATVYVFDPSIAFELDESGNPIANRTLALDGIPTENRARIAAQKAFGKNVLVLSVDVDETKLKVSPELFIANSEICKEGESYGREFVTQTFKLTHLKGFYTDKEGLHQFEEDYAGETTESKLRRFLCDKFESQNVVITFCEVTDERRYMKRADYLELAK